MPFPTARALAATTRELLTRAALLYASGQELEAAARKSGLLAGGGGGGGIAAPTQPLPEPPLAPASRATGAAEGRASSVSFSGAYAASGGGGTRLTPLPMLRTSRMAAPAPAPVAPLEGATDPQGTAAGAVGEGRLPAGPDDAKSALGRGAGDGGAASPETSREGGGISSASGGTAAVDGQPPAPTGSASHDPWVDDDARAAAGGLAATDDERLALWTTWLPPDVVHVLSCPGEAIGLYGGGGDGQAAHALIPLGDRMADDVVCGGGGE